MPQNFGGPRIGRGYGGDPKNPKLSSQDEELLHVPEAEEIGTISREKLARVMADAPPPPWESDPRYFKQDTDARKFVEAPAHVTLRWLNPKLVAQTGLRDWQAVSASDPRFTIKLQSLIAPDNTVRRGDHQGDFLAWMYTAWVESRNQIKQERVKQRTQKAADDFARTKEAFERGTFSRYVGASGEAHHPSHTQAEGSTVDRD